MKIISIGVIVIISLFSLNGCSKNEDGEQTVKSDPIYPSVKRWYTQEQVSRGNPLYQANCARCHQPDASGTKDWRKLDENNKYPPPPLNGTAHTWHHPLLVLQNTVARGGIPLGGSMPGFANKLSKQEINDILAWVQSHWPDEIYVIWQKNNEESIKRR